MSAFTQPQASAPPKQDAANSIENLQILLTAAEAFPAFERLCLSAKLSIVACFRVFDPAMPLVSPEARTIGETWADLLAHVLDRGVRVDITISDFDPILATEDHRRSWDSARKLAKVAETCASENFAFSISMHPARVGFFPRKLFSKKVHAHLRARSRDVLTPGLGAVAGQKDLPLMPATHHQKLCVVDNGALYIGGLDLDERRWDTLDHDRPANQTWHDVQAIVRGTVVQAALDHLNTFRGATAGQRPAPPARAGFLRTLSARRRMGMLRVSPRPIVTEIEDAHLRAIGRAEGAIYLETQFFRHKPLARALADAARTNPHLVLCLVLPAAPEDVAFKGNRNHDAQLGAHQQVDALEILRGGFGDRLVVASPVQARRPKGPDERGAAKLHGAPQVYVHSKLSLFGDREAILSSANLNGRSMRWDTEAGLHLTRQAHVRELWDRMMQHWLGSAHPDPFSDPVAFIRAITRTLENNVAQAPHERPHFLVPFATELHEALATPAPGMPPEIV